MARLEPDDTRRMTEDDLNAVIARRYPTDLEAQQAQAELSRRAAKASSDAAGQLMHGTAQVVTATQALVSVTRGLRTATWALVIFTILVGAVELYLALRGGH